MGIEGRCSLRWCFFDDRDREAIDSQQMFLLGHTRNDTEIFLWWLGFREEWGSEFFMPDASIYEYCKAHTEELSLYSAWTALERAGRTSR